jgi:hypothetical protein
LSLHDKQEATCRGKPWRSVKLCFTDRQASTVANTLAQDLEHFPQYAGTTAALLGAMQIGLGALAGMTVGQWPVLPLLPKVQPGEIGGHIRIIDIALHILPRRDIVKLVEEGDQPDLPVDYFLKPP